MDRYEQNMNFEIFHQATFTVSVSAPVETFSKDRGTLIEAIAVLYSHIESTEVFKSFESIDLHECQWPEVATKKRHGHVTAHFANLLHYYKVQNN